MARSDARGRPDADRGRPRPMAAVQRRRRRGPPPVRFPDGGATVARLGFLEATWLARFSRPAGERVVHRAVLRAPPRRILEIGLGTLLRTRRVLRVVGARLDATTVHYVGLDRFEGRQPGDPPGVTLKEAHRGLHGQARVQLVPGNVDTALSRVCNHLAPFDLVLISADTDERQLDRCWFFLQRLTTPTSRILVEERPGAAWATLSKQQLDDRAARTVMKRAG